MRRITIVFFTLLAVVIAPVWVVKADSPHFIRASASLNSSGQLTVSWKEAGLGGGVTINYTAGAQNASGFYACFNGGGKHPQAANKEEFNGPVTANGNFTTSKNGSINGSLTASPPPPTQGCPGGQRLVLAFVSYTGITVTDNTNGISANVPGSLSVCMLSAAELAADPTLCS